MEVFALDLGNIQSKLKSSKKEEVIPSKFARYEELGNQSTSMRKSELDINEYEVNFDDTFSYAWGVDIAKAKVSRFIDTLNFENRYAMREFKLLATFAIGELAKDFKEAKNSILEVNVVTGVPTNEFNEEEVKSIMNVLKADHNITINGERLNIRVNEVKVLPQPVGTIYNEMLDIKGNIEKEDFEQQTIAVADCGGGTVLVDTLNDMNLSDTRRIQEEIGAHTLYDDIIANCIKEGITLRKNDIEDILRTQTGKYFYKQNIDESFEITKIVNRSIQKYTDDIINTVGSALKGTSNIDVHFFTGGGANLINQKQVLNRYKRAYFIKDSETANVKGFYKYGEATNVGDEVAGQ